MNRFVYDIKPKPTLYNGVQFRSKLEATWAWRFDRWGWNWAYEPFYVNGWLPDFIIKGVFYTLVEVKPFSSLSKFFDCGQIDKISNGLKQLDDPYKYDVLLLGKCPMYDSGKRKKTQPYMRLGWLWEGESKQLNIPNYSGHAALGLRDNSNPSPPYKLGFYPNGGEPIDRISGWPIISKNTIKISEMVR